MKELIPSGHKTDKISQRAISSYANNFFFLTFSDNRTHEDSFTLTNFTISG